MFWSWLFPARAKASDTAADPGEARIPPLSVGVTDGPPPAAPVIAPANTSAPTDAGAAAAVGAAFLLGAELALHGQAQHDPGDTSAATHPGTHVASHGDAAPGDPGPGDGGGQG
jgi:hypothetical protein